MIDARRYDWVPGGLAIMVTVMVAMAALTPYLVPLPERNLNLITQAQTTLWNGWLLILGFYFGTSQNSSKKDSTIDKQASAINAAQAALTPDTASVVIAPGETATVKADES